MNDELCVFFLFVSNILSVFFSMIAEMNQVFSQNGGVDVIDRTNYIFASREGI